VRIYEDGRSEGQEERNDDRIRDGHIIIRDNN